MGKGAGYENTIAMVGDQDAHFRIVSPGVRDHQHSTVPETRNERGPVGHHTIGDVNILYTPVAGDPDQPDIAGCEPAENGADGWATHEPTCGGHRSGPRSGRWSGVCIGGVRLDCGGLVFAVVAREL